MWTLDCKILDSPDSGPQEMERDWGAALCAMFTRSLDNILLYTYYVPGSGDSVVTKSGKNLYLQESYNLTGKDKQCVKSKCVKYKMC